MNNPAGRHWSAAAVRWVALASVLLAAGVFVRRGLAAAEAAATAPGVAVTSGFEEESFFSVWRAVHNRPVYLDSNRIPYASAYFNWLFYAGYALPVRVAVHGAGDAVIPRAGRLVTAAGALLGVTGLAWLLRRVLPGQPLPAAALATFVFFGPLVGWWAHSVRPDTWALALETAGLAVLLLLYRSRPVTAALLGGLLLYGAWAFKQTYVLGLGTAVLFLALRRQPRVLVVLVLASVVLWAATFAGLGPAYRAAFRATGTTNVFYLANGVGNLRDMFLKSLPLWLVVVLLARAPGRAAPAGGPARDACLLGGLGLLVTTPLAFAASCKLGAYSNYFFTPQLMLALLAAGLIATREAPGRVLAGFALAGGMSLLLGLGLAGQISLRPQAREFADTWATWAQEAEPRFSAINCFNEPWLNPGSPPLVLAYNYGLDRAHGRPFESGGVGGLIAAGYFRTLLLPTDTPDQYDGGSLRGYARGPVLGQMTVFRRRDPSSP